MKKYLNIFSRSIVLLYNSSLVAIYCVFMMLMHLSTAIGMDSDDIELSQSPQQHLNIQKKDAFEDNDLNVEKETPNIGDETLPLFFSQDKENPLISYIQKYLINDQPVEENLCPQRARFAIKVCTTVYGSTGGLPYISSCCKAGQGNVFLCGAFATGNVIASGGATIWAGLRIAGNLDPISNEEKETLHSSVPRSVFKHLSCNILGILTCIPGAYAVYKYNTGALQFLIVPGFLNNYMFSTSGYYEIANPDSVVQQMVSKLQGKIAIDQESDESKENLINHLKHHVIPTITENKEARDYLFEANIDLSPTPERNFLEKLLSLNSSLNVIEPPEKWKEGYPKKIIQGTSLIFPLSNTIVNYLLAYEATSFLVASPIFCHSFSIMIVIPGFMLDVLSSTETVGHLFDFTYNKVRARNSANFMSSFYPKLNLALPLISVGLASLSVTGGLVVSRDAVQDSPLKSLAGILPPLVFISNAISQSFQVRDVLHDAINYFSTFRGGDVAEAARKVNKLEKFTSIISNCVPSIFCDFWNKMGYQKTPESSSQE